MTKLKEEERKTESPKPTVFRPTPEPIEATPPAAELFSKQSQLINQFKRVHSIEEDKTIEENKVTEKDGLTLAKESYSIVQEEQSNIFSKTMYTELPVLKTQLGVYPDDGFNLKPEPPPEVGFIPKVHENVVKTKTKEDIALKVKKLEEFHKVTSPLDAPSGGVRLFPVVSPKPEPKVEKKIEIEKREERKIETLPPLSWLTNSEELKKETLGVFRPSSSIEVRPSSPRPSAEALAMEKLWANRRDDCFTQVQKEEIYVPPVAKPRPATSLGVMDRSGSPRPSQEGLAMDKIWAHKHKDSSLKKSWPPPQSDDEKPIIPWAIESKEIIKTVSKTQKTVKTAPPPTMLTQKGPIQYYNAESRLIRQTQSMDRQIVKECFSSDRKINDIGIEPGPPPSIGFAPPPERRTSLVETIEQDLTKVIQKQPSKQLPGAVRIIPPPPTEQTKKKAKRTNSLELRPFEKFPDLEPFPFKPDPPQPKAAKCPPPPTPTKFIKGNFTESDYESEVEGKFSKRAETEVFRSVRPIESKNLDSPKLKPGSPPQFLQTEQILSESGYMADTEEILMNRKSKTMKASEILKTSSYQEVC